MNRTDARKVYAGRRGPISATGWRSGSPIDRGWLPVLAQTQPSETRLEDSASGGRRSAGVEGRCRRTEKHGLSKKRAFTGMTRGGRNAYTWAIAHPDQVCCVYADNPGVSREALGQLGGLAKDDMPLLHVCGGRDPWLGTQARGFEPGWTW